MSTSHGAPASPGGASPDASAAASADARLLGELLDASTELVCAVDGAGRITYVNRAWERAIGYTRAEAASLPAIALVAPEHRAAYVEAARRLRSGEAIEALDVVLTARDGRVVACRGRATPVMAPAPDGGAPRCVGTRAAYREVAATDAPRTAAALRDGDARFRAALDGGGIAYAALRPVHDAAGAVVDFAYVEVNAEFERMAGMLADDVVGMWMTELWPALRETGFVDDCARVLATGEPLEQERESRDPRVSARWMAVQVVALLDGVAVLSRDVTRQKEAELELRLLQRVTHAVAESTDVPEAGALVLEAMCTTAGWEYGELWMIVAGEDGAPLLARGPVWHAPDDERLAAFAAASLGIAFARGEGLPGGAWAAGAPVLVPDLRAPGVAFARLDAAQTARLTSGVAVPVLSAGEVVAVLGFHTRDARRVKGAHVDLLAAVAAQVGTVVHRKLVENALAHERGFLSTVLDSLSEHVSVCSPDGRLVLFNQAARDAHGLPENADLPPSEWSAYYGIRRPDGVTPFPTDELPHVRALATRADVDGVEYVVDAPGRAPRTLVANARVLHGPDGELLGTVCAAHDMTAQKAAEAALRASEERHRALFERSSAIQWVVDPRSETIVDANATAARFYGYAPDALRGKPLREINVLPATALRALMGRPDGGPGGVVPHRLASGEVRMVEFHPTRVELDGRAYTHAVIHDVTDRIRVETALRQSESRLSLIYDGATDLMFLMAVERDADGRVADFRCESVNAAYLELSGLTAGQLVGRTLREILPPADVERVHARYAAAVESGDVLRLEEELALATGRLTVETTVTPVIDADGECTHVLGSARDVSARVRAEAALRESEARFRGVLETVRAVAMTLDVHGHVTFANDALLALTGWTRDEVVGHDWFARFVPDGTALRDLFAAMVAGTETAPHYESEIVTRAGARRMIAWDNTLMHDATGAVTGTASIGRDVTEQRALEQRLAALSEHDELTGLLNRRGFRRMAEHELRVGRRAGRRGSLLYLDMDGFKQINDVHGHGEGDLALRAVAQVLRTTLREGDLAGRLGGDEFVVYATGAPTADEGEALAARLREQLARANDAAAAAGRAYALRASIGVATVDDGDDLDTVITRADAALYARKLSRRAEAASDASEASAAR